MNKNMLIHVSVPTDWLKLPSDKLKGSKSILYAFLALVWSVVGSVILALVFIVCALVFGRDSLFAIYIKDWLLAASYAPVSSHFSYWGIFALIIAVLCPCAYCFHCHCHFILKLAFEDRKTEEMRRDSMMKWVEKLPVINGKTEIAIDVVNRSETRNVHEVVTEDETLKQ